MDAEILRRLNAARRERRATVLVTETASAASRLHVEGADLAGEPLAGDVVARMASGVSGLAAVEDGPETFLTVHLPPPRLVVVGAVHVSQALAPMARLAGFEVTIVDPRTAFASPERFPDVRLVASWPQDAFAADPLDRHTALAAITHDPKIDDGALQAALDAGCFYVGALGSRKTHAKRRERLAVAGIAAEALVRIHAPIGVDIGAKSPAEIAVAILAEVIGAMRRRGLESEGSGGVRL